eukprot:11258221-Heterocapsa_arctica.AAC.1
MTCPAAAYAHFSRKLPGAGAVTRARGVWTLMMRRSRRSPARTATAASKELGEDKSWHPTGLVGGDAPCPRMFRQDCFAGVRPDDGALGTDEM